MSENTEIVAKRHCTFCGKSEDDCQVLISASDKATMICDECVDTCRDIIGNHRCQNTPKVDAAIPNTTAVGGKPNEK